MVIAACMISNRSILTIGFIVSICVVYLVDGGLIREGTNKENPQVLRCGFFVVFMSEMGAFRPPSQPNDGGLLPRRGFLLFTLQERRKLRAPETHPYFAERTLQHPDDEDGRHA